MRRINNSCYTWDFLLFWLNPILSKIRAKQSIEVEELPTYNNIGIHSENNLKEFKDELLSRRKKYQLFPSRIPSWLHTLQQQQFQVRYEMIISMIQLHFDAIWKTALIKLVQCIISFINPILIGEFISCLISINSHETNSIGLGLNLLVILLLSIISSSILSILYSKICITTKMKVNSVFLRMLFHRVMNLPSFVWDDNFKAPKSQIMTILQVDVDKISNVLENLHDLWILPINISLAFWLLYQEVKIAFVFGVLVILIMIPINLFISRLINNANSNLMIQKDKRVEFITSILGGMKAIKFISWENVIINKCFELRKVEIGFLRLRQNLDAICVFLWAALPVLIPCIVFISSKALNIDISVKKSFTALALLNTLIFPMNAFPWIVNTFLEMNISFCRIISILSDSQGKFIDLAQSSHKQEVFENCKEKPIISLHEVSWYLNKNRHIDTELSFLLHHHEREISTSSISLEFQRGHVYCLMGPTGCGKSSILRGISGELQKASGYLNENYQRSLGIAYSGQCPTLHSNKSIRENILFGQEFDSLKYSEVIYGCKLEEDFHQILSGDLTLVFSNATNLSGGQKSRISIARSLYSDCEVVLLDSPLDSLDRTTMRDILSFLISDAKKRNRLILITSSDQSMTTCSEISIINMDKIYLSNTAKNVYPTLPPYEFSPKISEVTKVEAIYNAEDSKDDVFAFRRGHIRWSVIQSYIRSVGSFTFSAMLVSLILMQMTSSCSTIWLSYWIMNKDQISDKSFYYLSCLLVVVSVVFTSCRAYSFAKVSVVASEIKYQQVISSILLFPIEVFESSNAIGNILFRLGNDIQTLDNNLPFILNIFLAQFFSLIAALLIMLYTNISYIFILMIVLTLYYHLQDFYRYTSRELRRLDGVVRSPMYSLVYDCIADSIAIRQMEKITYFEKMLSIHLDKFLLVTSTIGFSSLWLNIRLQLLGGLLTSSLCLFSLLTIKYSSINLNETMMAFISVSISFSFTLVGNLHSTVTSLAEVEKEFVSLERIEDCIQYPTEKDDKSLCDTIVNHPEIIMKDVSMKYSSTSQYVLHNLNLIINPGDRVAIVGRTGRYV